jgi:soluble lytic murein transglycosylase-like protein
MPDALTRRTRRFGFMIRHRALWISELLATVMVGLLLVCFMSIMVIILLNYLTIRESDRSIAALKSEKIQLAYTLEKQRRETRVFSTMQKLAGKRVSGTVLHQAATLVCRSSDQFGYDPLLLVAVIRVEGVFDPFALGRFRSGAKSGALGLMQLKYKTAVEVARRLEMELTSEKDLFNPEINLVLGVAYLTQLIKRFRSFKLGLIAYNLGPGAVRQTVTKKEALPMKYYQKVLRNYYDLKRIAANLEPNPAAPDHASRGKQ